RIFSSDKTFYAVFNSADGLEASAPVMTKGFRIGTVEKVDLDLKTQNIIVKISVQQEYPVPRDSKAKIGSTSLLGGKDIELQFGQSNEKFKNKDTIPTIFEPSIIQMAGAEYSSLKGKLSSFYRQLDAALEGINGVLSQKNVTNLEATMANINSLTTNLDILVKKESANISHVVGNLTELSKSLRETAPKLNNTIDNINKATATLPPVIENAATAIESLSHTLQKIERGEGNIGKLVNDEALYQALDSTVVSLQALITDIKLNPKRYVNITVFGRKSYVEKQADKAAKKAEKQVAKQE
ncbi:MAG: MlaD family protein, partial [Mucinivorans sp.]